VAFRKGEGGRTKGAVNKTTKSAKEAFALAFDKLGGYENMVKWAQSDADNLKTFYTLYARLIPVDVTSGGEKIRTQVILPHVPSQDR
jgi:hypothetical protein